MKGGEGKMDNVKSLMTCGLWQNPATGLRRQPPPCYGSCYLGYSFFAQNNSRKRKRNSSLRFPTRKCTSEIEFFFFQVLES